MAGKRVTDVSSDYEGATPASDSAIARIKREATALRMGKLERDVDAVLRTKGLLLDQSLGGGGRAARGRLR